jgi:hypothetical protein
MFIIENEVKAKKSARALEKFLAKQGVTVVHGHALNAIAAIAGHIDWNSFHASLAPVASVPVCSPSITDVDFHRLSEVHAFGSAYDIEVLDAYNAVLPWLGKWHSADNPYLGRNVKVLRLESQNEEVYGSESMTVEELLDFSWDRTMQHFVNSDKQQFIFRELTPYSFDEPVASSGAAASAVPTAFSILDVDFTQVTGLSRGEDSYWVDARAYAEALAWVPDWSNPANTNDADVPVLDLTYLDDSGFLTNVDLAADELLALSWNEKLHAFVNLTGVVYRFVVSQPVGPGLPRAA